MQVLEVHKQNSIGASRNETNNKQVSGENKPSKAFSRKQTEKAKPQPELIQSE